MANVFIVMSEQQNEIPRRMDLTDVSRLLSVVALCKNGKLRGGTFNQDKSASISCVMDTVCKAWQRNSVLSVFLSELQNSHLLRKVKPLPNSQTQRDITRVEWREIPYCCRNSMNSHKSCIDTSFNMGVEIRLSET